MADKEVFKALRGKEFDIEHAAKGEDHEEAVDALGGNSAGIGPIALCFLCWQDPNGKKGFGGRLKRSQIIPQDRDAARVAQRLNLLEDPHAAQSRIGFNKGLNFFFKGVELGGPGVARNGGEGFLL